MRGISYIMRGLILFVVFLFVPSTSAEAKESEAEIVAAGEIKPDIHWTIDTDGTLVVSGTGEIWTFPGSDDLPIPWWYEYRDLIKTADIKDGITELDLLCFGDHVNLTAVYLPDSLTDIASCCFDDCVNLQSITLPSNLKTIGGAAFKGSGITELEVPASVNKLNGCLAGSSIQKITIAKENTTYVSEDNVIFSKDGTCLIEYAPGKTQEEYVVPEGVETIHSGAFSGCLNLAKITIPNSVISIGGSAFAECGKLQSVLFPQNIPSINTLGLFSFCISLEKVELPSGVTEVSDSAFSYCTSLKKVILPEGVKKISHSAFHECNSLVDVVVPSTVTEAGANSWNCLINNAKNVSIRGYSNTLAEEIAQKYGYNFVELERDSLKSCKELKIILSRTTYTYGTKAWKPAVTVTIDGVELQRDIHYKVTYKNNRNVGTATVTVTGIGKYSGSKSISYKINPQATTIAKLTPKTRGFTATIKKQATQTTGYQLRYSTSEDMSGAKTVTITDNSICRKQITKLRAKQKYYVQVRTYMVKDGKKYYSAWSQAKTVVTK